MRNDPPLGRFSQAPSHQVPSFNAKFHPSVQNRSTLQLIYHPATGGQVMAYAIGHSIACLFALLGFLVSFMGKTQQKASATELKRILQAGEFAQTSEEPSE
jgi:hypothetical protein